MLELDTDVYRAQTRPAPALDPLAALNDSMPAGMGNMLTTLRLLMRYSAMMRQLMQDSMLFVFIAVCTNAAWQMTLDKPIDYVALY